MSEATPRISVIMPVFNGAVWLPESLGSIRRQERPGLELVIVDDGSTDASAEVVRRLAPAARYFHQANKGCAAARNTGLARATGEWITFLDQDDVWPDGSLAARVRALQENPAAWFVLGRTRQIFSGPAGAGPAPWVSTNLGAGLYRRGLFDQAGPFDETCRLTDDVEWFLRVREQGLPYVTLAEVMLHYRRGTGGITQGRSWRDPELKAILRESLARRRAEDGRARELPLLSGDKADPRAAGPVNPDRHDRAPD